MRKRPAGPSLIFLLGLLVLGMSMVILKRSHAAELVPERFQAPLKRSAGRWLPGVDWRLWAAQVYQESRFNCKAVSPVGARGCAQVMPGTWKDVSTSLGWQAADPFSADLGIEAGAYYMARMRAVWKFPRPEKDRHDLAMASYNAGAGHIIRAQKLAGGALHWPPVATKLPEVTGKHSRETIMYVQLIRDKWYPIILIQEAM
jgi:soluble lytic murein transglycosylase-like protein